MEVAAALPRASFASAEARVRSAAGRAYYGTYNLVCELLRSYDVHPGRDHGQVPTLLSRLAADTGDDRFHDVGVLLGDLYQARHKADYHLSVSGPWKEKLESPDYAETLVSKAHSTCSIVRRILASPPPRRAA